MKTRMRITLPNISGCNMTDAQEEKLNLIKDSFNALGITCKWCVDDRDDSFPVFVELHVPGSNTGNIELLKLKKYIF